MEGDHLMLDGIPVANLTPPVLLAITVLLVLLGILVPRRVLNDQIKATDKWQKAYEVEREARIRADAQTTQLLELAKTTNTIVVAAFGTSVSYRQSGGEANVVSAPKSQ
jgi:hypothetical protein